MYIAGDVFLAQGGFYVDGKVFREVDKDEIREIAEKLKETSTKNVVVSGKNIFFQTKDTVTHLQPKSNTLDKILYFIQMVIEYYRIESNFSVLCRHLFSCQS